MTAWCEHVRATEKAWQHAERALAYAKGDLAISAASYLDALDRGDSDTHIDLAIMRKDRARLDLARATERASFARYIDATRAPSVLATGPADERYLVETAP